MVLILSIDIGITNLGYVYSEVNIPDQEYKGSRCKNLIINSNYTINKNEIKKQSLFGDSKLLISIIIILLFMFVLVIVVLYKLGIFEKIIGSLKPMVATPIEINGIGQN